MEHTSRLFSCIRCHAQTSICAHCDRGQIYCNIECANIARLQSKRDAQRRYQLTPGGRMKHALRQQRYRNRLRIKVTHHSSIVTTQDGLLRQVKNKAKESVLRHVDFKKRCCFCKKSVSPYFRQGFLRHHSSIPARSLPHWRLT